MSFSKITLIAFVCAVIFIVSAAGDESENADDFVDQILNEVRTNSELPIDPIDIPDRAFSFIRKVLGVDWKGELRLSNGVLNGLSTISRTGRCTIKHEGDIMKIAAVLGMGVIQGKTKANLHFMNHLGPAVTFATKIEFVEVDLGIEVDLTDDEAKSKMTNFKLRQVNGLQLTMSGLGPLDYLFNFFSKIFTKTFRFNIKHVSEKILAKIVQKKISEAKLPF